MGEREQLAEAVKADETLQKIRQGASVDFKEIPPSTRELMYRVAQYGSKQNKSITGLPPQLISADDFQKFEKAAKGVVNGKLEKAELKTLEDSLNTPEPLEKVTADQARDLIATDIKELSENKLNGHKVSVLKNQAVIATQEDYKKAKKGEWSEAYANRLITDPKEVQKLQAKLHYLYPEEFKIEDITGVPDGKTPAMLEKFQLQTAEKLKAENPPRTMLIDRVAGCQTVSEMDKAVAAKMKEESGSMHLSEQQYQSALTNLKGVYVPPAWENGLEKKKKSPVTEVNPQVDTLAQSLKEGDSAPLNKEGTVIFKRIGENTFEVIKNNESGEFSRSYGLKKDDNGYLLIWKKGQDGKIVGTDTDRGAAKSVEFLAGIKKVRIVADSKEPDISLAAGTKSPFHSRGEIIKAIESGDREAVLIFAKRWYEFNERTPSGGAITYNTFIKDFANFSEGNKVWIASNRGNEQLVFAQAARNEEKADGDRFRFTENSLFFSSAFLR